MTIRPAAPASTKKNGSNVQPAGPKIPLHVAIIMDGNGRWAQERGLSRQAGHRAGTENIRRIIQAFGQRGVRYLTLFAFSTENWSRPRREVNALMRLIGRVIEKELKALHENNVRLVHIGTLDPLPGELQKRVTQAIELTKDNDGLTVCVAFNYGGRAELVEAAKRIIAAGLKPEQLDEATFACYLDTKGIPDPDLVIRTAGEMRLSNFLIWQAAYAEYYSTPVYWPDFDEKQIDLALDAYAARGRRFGGLVDTDPATHARNGNGDARSGVNGAKNAAHHLSA
ncbi:MAG: polyprenyl diphosphate synthase [Dehalococcoidia bacterium]